MLNIAITLKTPQLSAYSQQLKALELTIIPKQGPRMGWFKDRHAKKPHKLTRVMTKFIGEQDGPSERDLKARFVEILREQRVVERAYLALADHGDGTGVHITLAIKSSGVEDLSLVRKLQGIFSAMFNSHEHLDMMFIREDQEHQLREVCAPFYRLTG
jgi:hypothetical protein